MGSQGEVSAGTGAIFMTALWVLAYVTSAALVRFICEQHVISSAEFMYLSTPWGLSCATVLFLLGVLTRKEDRDASESIKSLEIINFSITDLSAALPLLAVNAILAVLVQFLMTWTANNNSTVLYAVMGQAKTAATVALSVFLLDAKLSLRCGLGLCLCLAAAVLLAIKDCLKERFERRGFQNNLNIV